MKNYFKAAGILFLLLSLATLSFGADSLSPKKQTVLGLYVTAKQAFEKWQANPADIKMIDVRTPEEYIFVGHAPMAFNLPVEILKKSWDAEKRRPVMEINPRFVSEVKNKFTVKDVLFIMCRSGNRSAMAINLLSKAGFTEVYNIIDGFEGDMVRDKKSPHYGKRTLNGWKNSDLPWTYRLKPELMYAPETN